MTRNQIHEHRGQLGQTSPQAVLAAEPQPRPQSPPGPIVAPPVKADSAPPPSSNPGPANVFPGIVDPKPEAIVITCSDPRFHSAFRAVCGRILGADAGNVHPFYRRRRRRGFRPPGYASRGIQVHAGSDRASQAAFRLPEAASSASVTKTAPIIKSFARRPPGSGKPFHAHLPREDMKLVAQVTARLLAHLRDAVGNVLRPLRRRRSGEGRYRPSCVNAVGGPVDRCEAIRGRLENRTDVAFVTAHAVPGKIVPLIRWRHTGRSTPLRARKRVQLIGRLYRLATREPVCESRAGSANIV